MVTGFFHQPPEASFTTYARRLRQEARDERDYFSHFIMGDNPIPRDNTRFLRAGLERFRETLNHGFNNVVTGFTQSIGSVMGQPNAISGYFG